MLSFKTRNLDIGTSKLNVFLAKHPTELDEIGIPDKNASATHRISPLSPKMFDFIIPTSLQKRISTS